jgi:hypothetical protein
MDTWNMLDLTPGKVSQGEWPFGLNYGSCKDWPGLDNRDIVSNKSHINLPITHLSTTHIPVSTSVHNGELEMSDLIRADL